MTETLVARGPVVPPFYAGEIAREAAVLAEAGHEIVPMHFGQPTLDPPPAVIEGARRAMGSENLGYWESWPLRERLSGITGTPTGLSESRMR